MEPITIKKSDIIPLLGLIAVYSKDDGKIIYGLLGEKITLGTKRVLQKIQKALQKEYEQLVADRNEIVENKELSDEEKKKEIEELLEETVKIDTDRVDLSKIESIETNNNYDFEILEKIGR